MRILHTSDWHLGRTLYGRKRYDEFAAFLDWLLAEIESARVDCLLIAGDVFDTGLPGNRAQELYYGFLARLPATGCRQAVVIGGNHDSPTFLDAPRALLKALKIHVLGSAGARPEAECLVLTGAAGEAEAIVCAVPYLRDRDIRTVETGEDREDKTRKLIAGIRSHYAEICRIGEEKRQTAGDIPLIATGHLFAAGGMTSEGDGVRDLYVGTLAHVGREIFPQNIDYLALGHLHMAQKVAGCDHIRYSGSPVPMGYGEAGQGKKVLLVDFAGRNPVVSEISVPCFQELERISGGTDDILAGLKVMKAAGRNVWVEVEYTGQAAAGNLRELIDQEIEGSRIEIRRIKNRRLMERIISRSRQDETLDDLDEQDVFNRCLASHQVPAEQQDELRLLYRIILSEMAEADQNAG